MAPEQFVNFVAIIQFSSFFTHCSSFTRKLISYVFFSLRSLARTDQIACKPAMLTMPIHEKCFNFSNYFRNSFKREQVKNKGIEVCKIEVIIASYSFSING